MGLGWFGYPLELFIRLIWPKSGKKSDKITFNILVKKLKKKGIKS